MRVVAKVTSKVIMRNPVRRWAESKNPRVGSSIA